MSMRVKPCLLRHGANSASTADVTRMRISPNPKSTGLKTGHYKTLGGGEGHALGTVRGDVAVGFVPVNGALQRCGYRHRLKTQFAFGTRAVHKHHVAR